MIQKKSLCLAETRAEGFLVFVKSHAKEVMPEDTRKKKY